MIDWRKVVMLGVAGLMIGSLPAWADDDEIGQTFDLAYTYRLGDWGSFTAPMHNFRWSDRSGTVGAVLMSLAGTEANRRRAEDEAIRGNKSSYSYAVRFAEPNPGLHLSMDLGTGQSSNGLDLRRIRLGADFDLWELFGGALNLDFGYDRLYVLQNTVSGNPFGATSTPLRLAYRVALPLPLVGLTLEPSGQVDATYLMSGLKGATSYGYGLKAGLVLDPQWVLDASYQVTPYVYSFGSVNDGTITATTMSVGTTMSF